MSKKKENLEQSLCENEEIKTEQNETIEVDNKIIKQVALEKENEELKNKLAELEDKYLRANADFENIKKRYEKEKAQAISYAHEQFSRDLLSIIDALEMASVSGDNSEISPEELSKKVKEGIDLTIEQFKKCFEKHGIKSINTNDKFDPNFHDAVMQVDSQEHKTGDIVQVLQKGYTIKDRILRPAMVSIAK